MGIETAALALSAASAAAAGAGAYVQARSNKAAAESSANMAAAQADAERRKADQVRAVSQRNAEEESKKLDYMMGKQRAAGASSGGGMDGSVGDSIANTALEQQYRSDLALWEGEQAAAGRDDQAALYDIDAKNKRSQASKMMGPAYLQIASGVMGTVGGAIKPTRTGRGNFYGDDDVKMQGRVPRNGIS